MKKSPIQNIMKKLEKDQIRFDCRYYTGYKPCGKSEFCAECKVYEPWGLRILIIKLAALGDVLRTTPILPGLVKKFPGARITWITDPAALPLLRNNPLIHRLLSFNAEGILVASHAPFDLALNFEKEDRALALMDSVNARAKLGFAFSPSCSLSIANDASLYSLGLGLHDELKFRHNTKSYQETIYDMAELSFEGEDYVLNLSAHALDFAEKTKARFNLPPDKFRIGLNTGCGDVFETKCWTLEGFSGLAKALARDGDSCLLLLGGKKEREFNRSLLAHCDALLIDTGCDNSLEEFLGIISLCDVVVSSDSLAAHIALALGKQTVIFFGSTCPREVELYNRGEKIVSDFPCSPCYLKTCDKNITCMSDLKPETVYQAVRRRIQKLPSSRK